MRTFQKLLFHQKTGKKFLVKDLNDDFHTEFGTISSSELKSKKIMIESNKKEKFLLITPRFPDLWENLQRGPQVMLPKDVGLILAKTGVNKNSRVVDAGGGSGSLCFSLAQVCKEVIVYEINSQTCTLLSKNKELFKIKNITVKPKDIYQGIEEKDLDLITLDLSEPWRVLNFAENSLQDGAYLVVYLPNLTQVQQLVESAQRTKIKVLETLELLERKWKIEGLILRPEFQMLGHTGFLIFCRKL